MNSSPPVVDQLAILSDPIRVRMLSVLEGRELTVSELCDVVQLPQSTVSRHLKTLADGDWVSSRRDGTSRLYTLPLEELDSPAKRLWQVVREQVSSSAAAAEDDTCSRTTCHSRFAGESSSSSGNVYRREVPSRRELTQSPSASVFRWRLTVDCGNCTTSQSSETVSSRPSKTESMRTRIGSERIAS